MRLNLRKVLQLEISSTTPIPNKHFGPYVGMGLAEKSVIGSTPTVNPSTHA